ncbi:serine hydrolase domain-containing protein [Cellulomonas endophytica]|uniref:serine hydrolase domain-containing protein n=1 Tax=Cellulomonas endophytica TaxID=2494735 RepID=UPI00101241B9|nr:serine hydrolase domain-containing protein [Cellulomonas endophytica]
MDAERARDLLVEGCARRRVPGAQLGLLRGDDRVVLCAGTVRDGAGAPVTPATAFHAGSLAKSLAAAVVLGAARRGDLDLDRACGEQADGLGPDSPRALLSQTSGLPEALPGLDEPLEPFVARVLRMPRLHAPGRFAYSNAGWSVLDLLLQRRTGHSFEEVAARVPGQRFGRPEGAADGHAVSAAGDLRPAVSDAGPAASAAGSRWWATADELLDHARRHLRGGEGVVHPDDVAQMQRRHADMPGATVADGWGLGWAVWDRGGHHAFGWAGYTGGHRSYLRCFPGQDAALVLLTNAAGPLLGPPGGSALFDELLPDLLGLLGVPPLPPPSLPGPGHPTEALAGQFGPLRVQAQDPDTFLLHAAAFGEGEPLLHHRLTADTFVRADGLPGGMALALEADRLSLGPFALPRTGD